METVRTFQDGSQLCQVIARPSSKHEEELRKVQEGAQAAVEALQTLVDEKQRSLEAQEKSQEELLVRLREMEGQYAQEVATLKQKNVHLENDATMAITSPIHHPKV